jgi:hypothetical protein
MAKSSGWFRRILLSRFATFYVVVAILVAAFANEYVNDSLVLREGGVPRYMSVRLKPSRELLLGGGGRTLVHVGFRNGFFGFGTKIGQVVLGNSFTIEVVGTPGEHQPAYAHLISNHPGTNNYEGVAIRHDEEDNDAYHFMFGNGKQWLESKPCSLPPMRQFYLAAVVEHNRISLFKDGAFVLSDEMGDVVKNSGLPLYVGNWASMDHRFNGRIDEARITEGALSPDSIRQNAQRLGPAFPD